MIEQIGSRIGQATVAAIAVILTAACAYLWATGETVPGELFAAWTMLVGLIAGIKIPDRAG